MHLTVVHRTPSVTEAATCRSQQYKEFLVCQHWGWSLQGKVLGWGLGWGRSAV